MWNNKSVIEQAILTASSKTEAIQNLGLNPKGSITRRKLNDAIKRFNIPIDHFEFANTADRWNNLPNSIKSCNSIADVLRSVGLQDKGNNHKTAKKVIKQMGLDISHFTSTTSSPRLTFDEVFCENSSVSRATVRQWISRDNLIEEKCSECGLYNVWNGKPIQLQLEHINGVSNDNRLENLTYLCPNCHSQTNTWGRKHRGVGKSG